MKAGEQKLIRFFQDQDTPRLRAVRGDPGRWTFAGPVVSGLGDGRIPADDRRGLDDPDQAAGNFLCRFGRRERGGLAHHVDGRLGQDRDLRLSDCHVPVPLASDHDFAEVHDRTG